MPPARSRDARPELCARQVVLLTAEPRKDGQRCRVEHATPAAGVRCSSEPTGQAAAAQQLLKEGDADVALPSQLTPRGRALITGWRDLGT